MKLNIFLEEIKMDEESPTPSKPNFPKKKKKLRPVEKKYREIRSQSCCVDCGWNKQPNILKFHHLVPGNQTPSKTRRSRTKPPSTCSSLPELYEELKKGVFLCGTCHDLRHYDEKLGVMNTANPNLR